MSEIVGKENKMKKENELKFKNQSRENISAYGRISHTLLDTIIMFNFVDGNEIFIRRLPVFILSCCRIIGHNSFM